MAAFARECDAAGLVRKIKAIKYTEEIMAEKISLLQFWEALEYSGNSLSWKEAREKYETYKSKKLMIDLAVDKTMREHAEERSDTIINLMKQDGNVSEVFRSLL